jgi:hypothetical protein
MRPFPRTRRLRMSPERPYSRAMVLVIVAVLVLPQSRGAKCQCKRNGCSAAVCFCAAMPVPSLPAESAHGCCGGRRTSHTVEHPAPDQAPTRRPCPCEIQGPGGEYDWRRTSPLPPRSETDSAARQLACNSWRISAEVGAAKTSPAFALQPRAGAALHVWHCTWRC